VTVDPTALQHARLALAQIALSWPQLAKAADTTLSRRTPTTRHLTAEQLADLAVDRDRLARAEREDRDATERYRALPSTRPPADLDVVDVRTNVCQVVHTSLLLARSDLAPWLGRAGVTLGEPPRRVTPARLTEATLWLADGLGHTGGTTAASVALELRPAAERAYQVLGADPEASWTAMGTSRCPRCRQRSLYRWADSPDRRAWTRECRNPECECTGATCPCGRAGARAGSRHLWQA
jgi:hypothetical protein